MCAEKGDQPSAGAFLPLLQNVVLGGPVGGTVWSDKAQGSNEPFLPVFDARKFLDPNFPCQHVHKPSGNGFTPPHL